MDREISTKSFDEERNNGGGISRRGFLKGVGGVAAAATVLGLSGLKLKALGQQIVNDIPPSVTLPKETLLEMYRRMQRIRQGEWRLRGIIKEGIGKLVPGGKSTCHTSAGEEGTCVGVAMAMQKGDMLAGGHRSHGYPLAMGLDLKSWLSEFLTKTTGCNKGRGGSMHIAAPELGILGMSGVAGASVPIALGAAKAALIRGTKQVAISACGDAATNTSGWGTSLNLASIWKVPAVFVINNNQMDAIQPARWEQSTIRAGQHLSTRASGHAIPGLTVDGNDVFAVYKSAKWCIDRARAGKGPSVLECVTYRQWVHSGWAEHEIKFWPHNRPEELEYWLRRDPIPRFEKFLTEGLLTEAELAGIRKEVTAELEEALAFAIQSPLPDPEEVFKYYRETFKV